MGYHCILCGEPVSIREALPFGRNRFVCKKCLNKVPSIQKM